MRKTVHDSNESCPEKKFSLKQSQFFNATKREGERVESDEKSL
jgi:hypothetical protein